jgi:hypothetical protein
LIKQCAQDGERIGSIDERSIGRVLGETIKKITVITGLKLEDSSKDMFAVEYAKFMAAHYSNLNISEITAAFYINANEAGEDKVTYYGGFLTLEIIGQVLTRYRIKRSRLAQKINQQNRLPEPSPPTKEEEEKMNKEMVNQFYFNYLQGEIAEVSKLYAYSIYDLLMHYRPDLKPPAHVRTECFNKAKEHRKEELLRPNKSKQDREAAKELLKGYLESVISHSEETTIINDGKGRALLYIFDGLAKDGIKKIF